MLPPCPENYYADGTHELALLAVSLLLWTFVCLDRA